MTYERFVERVLLKLANAGTTGVQFKHEDGKYIAKCACGVTIIGNAVSNRVGVRWGSGHYAVDMI